MGVHAIVSNQSRSPPYYCKRRPVPARNADAHEASHSRLALKARRPIPSARGRGARGRAQGPGVRGRTWAHDAAAQEPGARDGRKWAHVGERYPGARGRGGRGRTHEAGRRSRAHVGAPGRGHEAGRTRPGAEAGRMWAHKAGGTRPGARGRGHEAGGTRPGAKSRAHVGAQGRAHEPGARPGAYEVGRTNAGQTWPSAIFRGARGWALEAARTIVWGGTNVDGR